MRRQNIPRIFRIRNDDQGRGMVKGEWMVGMMGGFGGAWVVGVGEDGGVGEGDEVVVDRDDAETPVGFHVAQFEFEEFGGVMGV